MKILNIDDNEDDRYFFKKALLSSSLDATLITASDELSGLLCMEKESPDCIFLDYHLPGTNGLEILQKLRNMGNTIPIIMLTGQENKETVVQLMKAGASDYIPKKDLTPETVRLSIESALRCHRLQKEKEQAQEELRLNEARLEEAQNIALIGNWEYTLHDKRVYLSKEGERIAQYTSLKRLSFSTFFRRVHHEDIDKVKKWMNKICIEKADVSFRLRIPGTDRYKFIHVNSHYPEGTSDYKQKKWIGTIQDITLLKKAMQETQKAKVGRKATSIVLFIGITIFLLSEAILDPFVDALQTSLLIAISFKGGFALFLKPIEVFLEKFMLSRMKP